MNFDFSKFATMTANTVESAFSEKPENVLADVAREIKAEEEKSAEKSKVKTLSPEEIAKQAKFLKEQKEKSEQKEEQKSNSKKKESKKKSTSKKTTGTNTKNEVKKEKPIVFSRPRPVVAYGDQVYIEEDTTATLDDIRKTLVETYGYSEFEDEDRCQMIFDAKSGEVYPHIVFKKKG